MPLRNRDDINIVTAVNVVRGRGTSTMASSTQKVDVTQRDGHTTKTVKSTKTARQRSM